MASINKTGLHIVIILLCLLPFAYLASIYPMLAEQVPTHFNLENQPDDYSSKQALWLITSLLALVAIGLYFLLRNIHHLDPKRIGQSESGTFNKLALGMAIFLTALNFLTLASTAGHFDSLQETSFVLLGALFVFLGNYMHSIKPNYFAGFRLPWTLSDEENWRLTHRLGGRVWVGGGLLIAIGGIVLSEKPMMILFISTVVVLILVPLVYSLMLFRKKQKLQRQG